MAERAVRGGNKGGDKRTRRFFFPIWLQIPVYTAIVVITVLGSSFMHAFINTYKIPGGSMEPTLRGVRNYGSGDKIIVVKRTNGFRVPFTDRKVLASDEPYRGDVVVFKTKGIDGLDQGKDFIKRLVGIGGESLQIVPDNSNWNPDEDEILEGQGHIYIDGQRLESPQSIADKTYYPIGQYGSGEISVPEDHYYMLGDYSMNSRDSRFWGFVPNENVVGKAVFIYWPPSRMGLIE
jgi:signal peptidase I